MRCSNHNGVWHYFLLSRRLLACTPRFSVCHCVTRLANTLGKQPVQHAAAFDMYLQSRVKLCLFFSSLGNTPVCTPSKHQCYWRSGRSSNRHKDNHHLGTNNSRQSGSGSAKKQFTEILTVIADRAVSFRMHCKPPLLRKGTTPQQTRHRLHSVSAPFRTLSLEREPPSSTLLLRFPPPTNYRCHSGCSGHSGRFDCTCSMVRLLI